MAVTWEFYYLRQNFPSGKDETQPFLEFKLEINMKV